MYARCRSRAPMVMCRKSVICSPNLDPKANTKPLGGPRYLRKGGRPPHLKNLVYLAQCQHNGQHRVTHRFLLIALHLGARPTRLKQTNLYYHPLENKKLVAYCLRLVSITNRHMNTTNVTTAFRASTTVHHHALHIPPYPQLPPSIGRLAYHRTVHGLLLLKR